MAGPYFFGAEGWRLAPRHFAERHGLIVIIALGESIVAIAVGASHSLTLGIGTAAVFGVALTAAMWWAYFDVVALVAGRRLASTVEGRGRNELARDSYSYLHLVMIAGIVLVAFGLQTTIGHFGAHLHAVAAFALLGGLAIYLLGHVAFRYRHVRTINRQRLGLAVVLFCLVPLASNLPALGTLAIANILAWAMIAYETHGYGEARERVRHQGEAPPLASS
jgi:low temperature requirement protein LtrA